MTLVQSYDCPRQEHFSVTPPDSSLSLKSEFLEQSTGLPELQSFTVATDVHKYSKDDLQQIFKTVLEV